MADGGPPGTLTGRQLVSPVLVGRADLLEHATRRLAAVADGRGHLLFLSGEAGIGKTRLLRELTTVARDAGFRTFSAFTFVRDQEVVGGTLLDLAGELLASEDAAVVEHGQAIRVLLGQPGRTAAALAEHVLQGTSGDGPALVALEDLHWADDVTLEVLERMARRVPEHRTLVVCTYRSDELQPSVAMRRWRSRLLAQRLAEEVRVPRLGARDTAAMAATITGNRLPAPTAAALHDHSDGIPLHVEELLATTSEDGELTGRVPETLAEAVRTRVGGLAPEARDAADAAAVLGRSFDVDLLTSVSGLPPDRVDRALGELSEHQVLQPRADTLTYDFRHALIRDALYADLPPLRRRDLHRAAAEAALAAGFGDAFVSDQFERAGMAAEAFAHAMRAAARAAALSAHREAVALYRRAQRTMSGTATDAERADLGAALAVELAATDDNPASAAAFSDAHELRMRSGDTLGAAALVPPWVSVRHLLGEGLATRTAALVAAGDLVAGDEPCAVVVRATIEAGLAAAYMLDRRLDEALVHGEAARALADFVQDGPTARDTEATIGAVLVFAGRMDEGWASLRTAIERSSADAHEPQAARAYRMIGSSASVLVEYDLADAQLREGIAYAELTERWNDRHYMCAHLAHVRWATGDWTAADDLASSALADGRGGFTTRITALHVLGFLALGRGETTAAVDRLSEALALADQMRELQRVSPAVWGLAEAALTAGSAAEAGAWCERGLAASAEVDDAAYLFPFVLTGTRSALAQGDVLAARRWIEQVEPLLLRRSIPGTLAAIGHARGLLLLAEGRVGQARDALAEAARGWADRQRFWEGTWALVDLARAERRSRLGRQAREHADAALQAALERGAVPLVDAAGSLITPTGHHEPDSAPLSSREYEVARLVAAGRTNREIAEDLVVSPKTVASHVEHILAKLGATRRAEVAAWVARRSGT